MSSRLYQIPERTETYQETNRQKVKREKETEDKDGDEWCQKAE